MYYKITNKESDIYKALHKMRSFELQVEKTNLERVSKRVGLEFDKMFADKGQQNMWRVTRYYGFEFNANQEIDAKIWKVSPKHPSVYIPNKKTKVGRDMAKFLFYDLESSDVFKAIRILVGEETDIIFYPFIEIIKDEMIIIWMSDKVEPTDEHIIEITKKEFDTHFELI